MKSISKCKWVGRFALTFDAAPELFYVTNKNGNKSNHIISIGLIEIFNEDKSKQASILMFTFIFVQIGVGWICKN